MPRNLRDELDAALARDAQKGPWAWREKVAFLDTLSSLEDLEELRKVAPEGSLDDNLLAHYREILTRWSDPKLPDGFVKRFPLVAARLDTPEKVRVFLRGADFRRVDPMVMGEVFEDIIHRHDVQGETMVIYPEYRGSNWYTALRIVYHTQIQAMMLSYLLLPNHTSSGVSSEFGLFIDWRSEEERRRQPVPIFTSHIRVTLCGTDINGRAMVRCGRCSTIAHAATEAAARADFAKTSCVPYCRNCNNLRNSNGRRPAVPQGGNCTDLTHVCPQDGSWWWQGNTHFHLWQQITSEQEWETVRSSERSPSNMKR